MPATAAPGRSGNRRRNGGDGANHLRGGAASNFLQQASTGELALIGAAVLSGVIVLALGRPVAQREAVRTMAAVRAHSLQLAEPERAASPGGAHVRDAQESATSVASGCAGGCDDNSTTGAPTTAATAVATTTTAAAATTLATTAAATTSTTVMQRPPLAKRLWRPRNAAHDTRPPPPGVCFDLDRARGVAKPGESLGSLNFAYDPGATLRERVSPRCRSRETAAGSLEVTTIDSRQHPPGPDTDAACRKAGKRCVGKVNWEPGTRLAPFRRGCSMATCFDKQRSGCQRIVSAGKRAPLPVYLYPREKLSRARRGMDQWPLWDELATGSAVAAAHQKGIVEVVENASDACVLIAMALKDIPAAPGGVTPAHWGESGLNHLLFAPRVGHPDQPGIPVAYGDSMLALGAHTPFTYRTGFDLQLPCTHRGHYDNNGRYLAHAEPLPSSNRSMLLAHAEPLPSEKRSMLLFFKGKNWLKEWGAYVTSRWWNDRCAALFLHDPDRGIYMESTTDEFKHSTSPDYHLSLANTRYAWAPAGGGAYSFRFLEALAAGAVPVVTSDLVLPLDDPEPVGELQRRISGLYRDCVVVVDPEVIPRMGHYLEAAEASGAGCAERRQRACLEIFHMCFDHMDKLFTCQMTVVDDRVRAALQG